MKRILTSIIITILLSLQFLPVFAANWTEIFEKQYVDLESIKINKKDNTVQFWVKALRKDPKELFDDKPYWYMINKWNISCYKYSRIESINVYDLNEKIIYSDSYIPKWNDIIPDTYADGYYRLFCLIPFEQNPLLK